MSKRPFCNIILENDSFWGHHYDKMQELGRGAYGVVWLAQDREDKRMVAIKHIQIGQSVNAKPKQVWIDDRKSGIPQDAFREIKMLKELSHDNIVKLERVYLCPDYIERVDVHKDRDEKEDKNIRSVFLVYEEAEMDLNNIIKYHKKSERKSDKHPPPADIRVIKSIIKQILEGLAFLHKNWVMHRDMKPANVLIKKRERDTSPPQFCVKIADFGLARVFQSPLRPLWVDGEVVTIWYRAPELILGSRHYTRAIDIWAVGCIFAEFLLAAPLFPGKELKKPKKTASIFQSDQMSKICGVLGKPNNSWPLVKECLHAASLKTIKEDSFTLGTLMAPRLAANSHGFDLLKRMLEFDPSKRITAAQALSHPFFTQEPVAKDNCLLAENNKVVSYTRLKVSQSKKHKNGDVDAKHKSSKKRKSSP